MGDVPVSPAILESKTHGAQMITIQVHPSELEFIKEAIQEKLDRMHARLLPPKPLAPLTDTITVLPVKRGPGRPRKVAK